MNDQQIVRKIKELNLRQAIYCRGSIRSNYWSYK